MNTRAVRALLALTSDAESGASVEHYHLELLGTLAKVFPCEVLVFNEFQLSTPPSAFDASEVTCTRSPPLEPRGAVSAALLTAFLRHVSQHPLIRLHAAGDPHARRLSDATAMRSFRRRALYDEFFRPAAIAHQMTLGLEGPPGHLVGIWCNRTRGEFSEDEVLLAELLRPQLKAAELAVRRAEARAALTSREREILDLVASGATNPAVAEALVVSPGTVKKHLDNIYTKLGVNSRAAAADNACTRTAEPRTQ
jgi:DNA-binding CsgD family transcriptional regulator